MGGLLSNIFDKNACVIRKTRFKIVGNLLLFFSGVLKNVVYFVSRPKVKKCALCSDFRDFFK